jgi:hypothetical protein
MSRSTASGRAVGIELCSNLVRGVLLGNTGADIAHASEVALNAHDDDRSVLDALIRLRADLGAAPVPARLATFPSGSWMRRVDVTGKTGPELNGLRSEIDRRHGAASTLLLDEGPRRWLYVLHWPDAGIRRIEALAERAGFVDVAVEPSPVALARVLNSRWTIAQRFAATGEAAATVLHDGMPVAAVSVDATGRLHPSLLLGQTSFSVELFDDIVAADANAELVENIRDRAAGATASQANTEPLVELEVEERQVPQFPPHDLRSPERQCVAIGAAVGAAGLTGRIRPVDIITDAAVTTAAHERPWVVERVTTVAPVVSAGPGAARRTLARVLPRRRH